MPCPLIIVVALALASPAVEGPAAVPPAVERQPVRAVLLRPTRLDANVLREALELRSPQRTIAGPPWPDSPSERFGLFAVVTVASTEEAVTVTVVLSDGRAYYRTLEGSPDDAPRVAASTIANLLAAIEEDELPPDEEDVPLPLEQDPPPEPTPPLAPAPALPPPATTPPKPAPPPPRADPLELEALAAGTLGTALGPPAPAGFMGGGGLLGLALRWPRGALVSLAVRSHWHRPEPLTVGRTRLSVGGGFAWRRNRFELRTTLALDVEPWGVRRSGSREPVRDSAGVSRERGLQLGGHLRLTPAWRIPLRSDLALRVGPRIELGGSTLAQTPGVARLLVSDSTGAPTVITRVGGLELCAGFELGLAWSLPQR